MLLLLLVTDIRLQSLTFHRFRRQDWRGVDVLVTERRAGGGVSRVAAGRHRCSTALRSGRAWRRHVAGVGCAKLHTATRERFSFRLMSSFFVVAACLIPCGLLAAWRADMKL